MMLSALAALAVSAAPADAGVDAVALPGGPPAVMDYLAFDAATGRLWIPAGNTARVDVLDVRSGKLDAIDKQPTAKLGERLLGPSSATVGAGVVFIGNRGDSSICGFDARTLEKKGCVTAPSMPDGIVWVEPTKEVWVTMPRDSSLAVLDVSNPAAPKLVTTIKLEGEPEGYIVDAKRGLFYTNLEDADRTLAIDVKTRKVLSTWKPGCGEKGPRGLALDLERRQLFVACTDGVKTLDAAKTGAVLSSLATGGGVDNIDYLPSKRWVYVASGADGQLTVAEVAADGTLKKAWSAKTAEGGRTAVISDTGTAFVPDSRGGRVVVRPAPAK